MNPPHIYAEWVVLLDVFSSGDDGALQSMQHGSVQWTNVVAERWTGHVADALNTRLQALSKQLQKNLDRARGDYFAISKALLGARRGLVPLRSFVTLPSFPESVRSYLISELERWIHQTQQSLESHALKVRDDQGRLLKTIRDNPLGAVDATMQPQQPDVVSQEQSIPTGKGRRVIF